MLPSSDEPNNFPSSARSMLHSPGDLRGPAGALEAVFTPGASTAPYAVVVSHPHPLFGGSMHNKVVYHAAKAFSAAGLPVLRYNFRGVGRSAGAHDFGRGESEDLRAAMRWAASTTGLPLLLCGFSFGAWVSLQVACASPASAHGVVALGLPIRAGDRAYVYPFLHECKLPKLFVSGKADAFGPVEQVQAVVATAAAPAQLVWVDEADHFFQRPGGASSGLAEVQAAIASWLARYFLSASAGPHDTSGAQAWQ